LLGDVLQAARRGAAPVTEGRHEAARNFQHSPHWLLSKPFSSGPGPVPIFGYSRQLFFSHYTFDTAQLHGVSLILSKTASLSLAQLTVGQTAALS